MKVPTFKNGDKLTFSNCTLAYGHFDSVHPGHIRYLRHAASQGENLVIALLPDTKKGENNSYQFSQLERADGLADFALINGIFLLDDEENALCKAIETLNPKLLVFGKEFEGDDPEINKAIRLMKKKGRKIKFMLVMFNMQVHYYWKNQKMIYYKKIKINLFNLANDKK